ncbi:hypothetical protein ACO2Q0_03185 [Phenylobacterium sp. VNQ135]|uniref:hypothetical protein n=1 Tax=Phenylobacterium sp. VNQ135 TaxID=3400922 RepID=UPI003C081C25
MSEDERLEAFRAQAHERDCAAVRGVAWSAMGPVSFRQRSTVALQADASRRAAARDLWRSSVAGRALTALSEVERQAEAIRAALSRDPAQDLATRGAALTAAAQAVLRALR